MGSISADETALWLELLREECGVDASQTKPLEIESSELIAIFTTMINRTRARGVIGSSLSVFRMAVISAFYFLLSAFKG